MSANDETFRQAVRDLGRALVRAASTSPEVGRAVRRIREGGYSVSLHLDCDDRQGPRYELELVDGRPPARQPCFLLEGEDVAFLRSIGIDPTRRPTRRRRG